MTATGSAIPGVAALGVTALLVAGCGGAVAPYRVQQDAIPEPLRSLTGDAARGRRLVLDRETGNCLICHAVPEPGERFQGDVAVPLAGVGNRLTPAQIRLRVVDAAQVNPQTVMPPYHRVQGLRDVAPAYRGQPVLSAQQVEDVVAYLASLREAAP